MSSSYRHPLFSSPLLSSAIDLFVSLLLLIFSSFSLLLSTRFSSTCSCSRTPWPHHALFSLGPFSLPGRFFHNRQHCICQSYRISDPTAPVGISSNETTSVSTEYALPDLKPAISFVYRRRLSRINSKDVTSGRFDDRDTDVWTGDVSEEEPFMSLLDEHRESGCQCGTFANRESQKWMRAKEEASQEEEEEEEEGGACDENGFKHGHCCDIVVRLAKALKTERINLRNVYMELEEERVAAETATNEAMAMILRLQEEKSMLKLEVAHYQRMAEEKAMHDERAIQILEDDLCKRDHERLLLEEELNELRGNSAGKIDEHLPLDSSLSSSNGHEPSSLSGSPLLSHSKELHTTTSRMLDMISEETSQTTQNIYCIEKDLSRWDHHLSHASRAAFTEQSDKLQPSAEDIDANSILIQLFALEKQLEEASCASEILDLVQTTQISETNNDDTSYDVGIESSLMSDHRMTMGCNVVVEKCVDIDVADMNHDASSYKAERLLSDSAEDVFVVQEENIKCGFQESEDHEEEKYLDVPSLVTSNSPCPMIANNVEACKTQAHYATLMPDWEEKLKCRKITLEDIDSRLQVLEAQTQFTRQQPVSSNYEHMNMVLLKDILQELRVILHPDQALRGIEPPRR